jgi:hypothetical protein
METDDAAAASVVSPQVINNAARLTAMPSSSKAKKRSMASLSWALTPK